jgi:carboxylesterase
MSTTLRYDGWAIPPWHFLPLALYTRSGGCGNKEKPHGVKNERIRAWIARELETGGVVRAVPPWA